MTECLLYTAVCPSPSIHVQVTKWPLGGKGLLFDREWMVLNELGSCLSQKQEPRLCLIQPSVDLATRKMTLKAEGEEANSWLLQNSVTREIVSI